YGASLLASKGCNMSGFDPTFVPPGAGHRGGSVPDPGPTADPTMFLRQDATFAVPTGTPGATGPGAFQVELAYAQFTAQVSATATTEAAAIVCCTLPSVEYPGTPVM